MYYLPKLSNGIKLRLPWALHFYRWFNRICWPLEDGVGVFAIILDRFYYIIAFLIFMGHNEAEIRYLYRNWNNIDELLTGMPTYFGLVEIFLRMFQLGIQKNRMKELLKEFYADIYIENSENPKQYSRIQRKLRPTLLISLLYISTLGLYIVSAITNVISNRREPLYKMIFGFDHTPLYIFYPILVGNVWIGIIVVSFLTGELNMISQMCLHLNGQFLSLGDGLESCAERLLEEADPDNIAYEFQKGVRRILIRNVELYKFAAKVQNEFSYRIFVWFALSAIFLCTLSFKIYTNPQNSIVFVSWSLARILELTVMGEVGSTLEKTSNEVSSMYYHSKWELIIESSSNTYENVRLMKLILIAMETSHKPVFLTGLNFFNVSLSAVITIIQGAGSYFTFLISLR